MAFPSNFLLPYEFYVVYYTIYKIICQYLTMQQKIMKQKNYIPILDKAINLWYNTAIMKKIIKALLHFPLVFLNFLGETLVSVMVKGFKEFIEFSVLTLKLIWDKTIKIRTKVVNIAKYFGIFVASPFVKMSLNFSNLRRDMRKQREQEGDFQAILTFFQYLGRFIFGKRGLAVTAFNYAAPVLSIIFLFNIVTYATSVNFTLRLVVNGEFLGYIENEQVFLDAEAHVLQRVNYFGSDQTIEVVPAFSIANSGSEEVLTMNQVSNMILRRADFNLAYAFGFFIDGVCYGAILDEDIHLLRDTIDSLLSEYASDDPDEEIGFLNNVSWDEYELFLEESIVDPQEIITMITATINGEPFLPVTVTRVEEYKRDVAFETVHQDDDTLFVGSTSITRQGVDGVNRVTARVTYVNGEEIRRNVIRTTLVSEPVTQVINRGTKPHTSGTVSPQQAQYGTFIWPVTNVAGDPVGGITQGVHGGHMAIDIAGGGLNGTPIVAGASGRVVLAQHNYHGYGHTVIIEHENGLKTLYAHNSALQVSKGEWVTQGQQIANLGTTGRSSGPHLHFEVLEGNRPVNPLSYLPRR
jgi:murein DD-endopeptidase MepM/ murein hydrolase activator NlpD